MISLLKLQKHLSRGYVRPMEHFPSTADSGHGPAIFRHWVVIPVCDEPDLPASLAQWGAVLPADAALLLVVNHPEKAAADRKARNLALLEALRGGMSFGMNQEQLFWTDAASPGKELHHGVGEARRIGYDTALSRLDPEHLESSILAACDGDTLIHPDYWNILLRTVRRHPACGAFCLGVKHQPGHTDGEEQFIRKYEAYLQAYVDGLLAAGSPYAYHSIGSAIAVRASAYLLAGGMRVCPAGEDFYFLQALRKVTSVYQMHEILVYPSARPSDRVPFGTGKAVSSYLSGESLPVYPAEAFEQLKQLLCRVSDEHLQTPEVFLSELSPAASAFLQDNHFEQAWRKVVGNVPARPGALARAFHLWFDALKTYRFIHSFMPEFANQKS